MKQAELEALGASIADYLLGSGYSLPQIASELKQINDYSEPKLRAYADKLKSDYTAKYGNTDPLEQRIESEWEIKESAYLALIEKWAKGAESELMPLYRQAAETIKKAKVASIRSKLQSP